MFILYDNNGKIIMTQTGGANAAENGVNVMTADIPKGYDVESINMETGEPVLYKLEVDNTTAVLNALLTGEV